MEIGDKGMGDERVRSGTVLTLALAIPAPVTPALPLFLAESDRPVVDA